MRWKANDWIERANQCRFMKFEHYNVGIINHANRQAWVLRCMADKFEWLWKDGTSFEYNEKIDAEEYCGLGSYSSLMTCFLGERLLINTKIRE